VFVAFRRSASVAPISAGSAAVRLASAFFSVLLVALSQGYAFVSVYITLLLVLLATRRAPVITIVLKSAFAATVLTSLVLLPAILNGNSANGVLTIAKTTGSVVTFSLLAVETRWESLFAALALARVPSLIILILDITLKHVVLLGTYMLNLLQSLKLRSVGHNKRKEHVLSGIAGTLFIRSADAANTLYQAMECRGFSGSYTMQWQRRLSVSSKVLIVADFVLLGVFLMVGS